MRVCFESRNQAFCVRRIVDALRKYKPDSIEEADQENADLVVLHVTGRNQRNTKDARKLLEHGKQYAIIQYSLKSTRNPDPNDWMELWHSARVVWSYYLLPLPDFYHAPLAADTLMFYPQDTEKKYMAGSIGEYFKAECIGELQFALWYAKGIGVHVGENFNSNPIIDYRFSLSDEEMREMYNSCIWFSCLRRKEGFEMTAIEALLCGVRPIMFDTPNYRQWFDGLAVFIQEGSVHDVAGSLIDLFKSNPLPVTEAEIEETKKRFNWQRIVDGFYSRIIC